MDDLKKSVNELIKLWPEFVRELDDHVYYIHVPPVKVCWCCGRVLAIDSFLVFVSPDAYIKDHSLCMGPQLREPCDYAGKGSFYAETCTDKDRDGAICKGQADN